MKNTYIVIMAGGSGTRLWPLSRSSHPKQFQRLTSEKQTLLQETYDRVYPLANDVEHIFISTTEQYASLVKEQLPDIADDNIIIEPCGRDTAPAMALVAHTIFKKDPEAIITTTPSDHTIKNPGTYLTTVQTAINVITDHPHKFGLIGITPTEPSTELGYIQMGKEISDNYKKRVFNAIDFKEKPDHETAKKYFSHWSYLWNAAYFVFKAKSFTAMVSEYTPHIAEALEKIEHANDTKDIHDIYCNLPKEPVDTAILEKLSATDRFVVPADLKWSDVGNWRTLHDFYTTPEKNLVQRGETIAIDSKNCMIFGTNKKTITILGLKDIIVVDTDDATFVTHRDHAHKVKKVIEKIKEINKKELL
ncbi:MAG: hypothetical protein CR972_04640 [Candidatus Moraniibacteriota bacterium]|nr:MAG: hypothetical protein CR972_04640 [Candidatus Moranbacteria bacterium]